MVNPRTLRPHQYSGRVLRCWNPGISLQFRFCRFILVASGTPFLQYQLKRLSVPKLFFSNPSPSTHLAPWCYIKAGGDIDWDYCDICSRKSTTHSKLLKLCHIGLYDPWFRKKPST